MLKLIRYIFILFLVFPSYGQTTIVVADGNAENLDIPIDLYYRYNYQEVIYFQSEIDVAGNITEICFEYNGYSAINEDVKIYLGHTSKTQFLFNEDWINASNMTLVFDGVYSLTTSDGWHCITLDTPFSYNNIDNLAVGVYDFDNDYHSSSSSFYALSTPSKYRTIYFTSDSQNPDPFSPPPADDEIYYVPSFQITFGTTLPADDLILNGECTGSANQLKWSSSSESNTKYHIVQIADETGVFVDVDTLKAIGNSAVLNQYSYTDNNPLPINYYRIKVVDNDGETTTLSNTIVLKQNSSPPELDFEILPNPTENKINIKISSKINDDLTINIYNNVGKLMFSEKINNLMLNKTTIIDVSSFRSGIYKVEIKNNTKSKFKRLIKI